MSKHIPLTRKELDKLPEAEQQSALQDIGRFIGSMLQTAPDKAHKLIAKLANEFDFDPNALMDMANPQSMGDVAGMALPGAGLAMGAMKGVSGAMRAESGVNRAEPLLQSRMGEVLAGTEKVPTETAQVVKPGGLQPPGAGATSMEAVSRAKSMKTKGEVLYRVDSRSGKSSPIMTGVDSPDIKPGAFDVIMRKKNGVTEIVDMGSQAKQFLGN